MITGEVTLWQVAILGTCFGALSAVDAPARLAITGELVRPEHLRGAVTLTSIAVSTARAAGPALAGAVAVAIGIGACFLLNAASFVAVLVALRGLEERAPVATPRGRGQLRAGLRIAATRPEVLAPLVMMALIGTFTYEFDVTLPLLAREEFAGGAGVTSQLFAAFGVGAVVGALYAAWRPGTGVRHLVRAALAFGTSTALAACAPALWLELPALAVAGAASVTFLTSGNVTAQLAASPEYRGRITALWSTAYAGSTPIGAPLAGAVADAAGARWSLAVGSGACLLAAVAGRVIGRRSESPSRPSRVRAEFAPSTSRGPRRRS